MMNAPAHPAQLDVSAFLGGLIVSCQAPEGSPLHGPEYMAPMASAAVLGGARGVRIQGEDDIRAVARAVDVPIIGLKKVGAQTPDNVFITPSFAHARLVVEAGASMVALDATPRSRPGGETLPRIIARIHDELGVPVMADIDTLESALYAEDSGADIVGTTLAGYTSGSVLTDAIDIALVREIATRVRVPLIAEGRVWTREDALAALAAGAAGVVVGSALTNPVVTTRRFVDAIQAR